MRPATAFAAMLLISVGLVACSSPLKIALYNDAGAPLTVRVDGKLIPIAPGQSAEFVYPGSYENWTILISDGTCEYLYQVPRSLDQVPRSLDHYRWAAKAYDDPIKTQMERDHSIYVMLPGSGGIADVFALTTQQVDGFPLHPVTWTRH